MFANSAFPSGDFVVATDVLKRVNQISNALTDALINLPANQVDIDWESEHYLDVKGTFFCTVKELVGIVQISQISVSDQQKQYASDHPDLYRQILKHMKKQNWIPANVYQLEMVC